MRKALFDAHIAENIGQIPFEHDVTADGKRFPINTTSGSGAPSSPPLNVVNSNEELKK